MRDRILHSVVLSIVLVAAVGAAHADDLSEEIVTFTTHDGFEIGCLLSYPTSQPGDRFPAMLLIAGSGLHDADVTLDVPQLAITSGRQTLFRPLARHFSRAGWVVLRCNKRGASFQHRDDRPALLEEATLEDLVDDARQALQTLHSHPRVAASPLVVLGHSEGSLVATRLALEAPAIDLLVLVGSMARSFDSLLEYQLVDRNLDFLRQAADADRDGFLTLQELDALDGNFGLGSVYVYNSATVLFQLTSSRLGEPEVRGFSPDTDINHDGRLAIDAEIEPRMRREAQRFVALAREGVLGRYWQSALEAEALLSYIHRVEAPVLFVHGELDVQTPVDEPLALSTKLESLGRADYELLVLPRVGHSLSQPNDFFREDEGLSLLDNLTLNAPQARARRLILQRIEAILGR